MYIFTYMFYCHNKWYTIQERLSIQILLFSNSSTWQLKLTFCNNNSKEKKNKKVYRIVYSNKNL